MHEVIVPALCMLAFCKQIIIRLFKRCVKTHYYMYFNRTVNKIIVKLLLATTVQLEIHL